MVSILSVNAALLLAAEAPISALSADAAMPNFLAHAISGSASVACFAVLAKQKEIRTNEEGRAKVKTMNAGWLD